MSIVCYSAAGPISSPRNGQLLNPVMTSIRTKAQTVSLYKKFSDRSGALQNILLFRDSNPYIHGRRLNGDSRGRSPAKYEVRDGPFLRPPLPNISDVIGCDKYYCISFRGKSMFQL